MVLSYMTFKERLPLSLVSKAWCKQYIPALSAELCIRPPPRLNLAKARTVLPLARLAERFTRVVHLRLRGFITADRSTDPECRGYAHLQVLFESLRGKIKSLDMAGCYFGTTSQAKLVVTQIESMRDTLETLDITDCRFGRALEALYTRPVQLKTLKMRGNGLGAGFGQEFFKNFKTRFSKVEYLDAGLNALSSTWARSMPDLFKGVTSVKTLILDDNLIGHAGALGAGTAVARLKQLEKLSISGADIRTNGCRYFMTAIKSQLPKLREFNISECWVSDSGVRCIAGCVPTFPALRTVVMRRNNIMRKALFDEIVNRMPPQGLVFY